MTAIICEALQRDRLIDITTLGRVSGAPHRIETGFHVLDGRVYLTGLPGKRDWYANLLANPAFTFHLKQSAMADLDARATPVTDMEQRRTILPPLVERMGRSADLDAWLDASPLVRIALDIDCPELEGE
jgi:hypothetical protein